MEGAKLVGEISTDWEGDSVVAPVVSDRLEAFTAAIGNTDDDPVVGDGENQ
jgi:hypothetical protein